MEWTGMACQKEKTSNAGTALGVERRQKAMTLVSTNGVERKQGSGIGLKASCAECSQGTEIRSGLQLVLPGETLRARRDWS
eukprot:1157286-Pelagomonas_calceolata.AAC.7